MPQHTKEVQEEKLAEVKAIFSSYLDRKKQRKTEERFSILEEIYTRNDHFEVEALYIQMKNKGSRVSRATVYNTLDLLVECNLVTKHQFGTQTARYEKSFGFKQHDHLICNDCGHVHEFCDPRLGDIERMVGQLFQFKISQHALVLHGHCTLEDCPHRIKIKLPSEQLS
jgi:Fur family ferric uptake transcriptional regulator